MPGPGTAVLWDVSPPGPELPMAGGPCWEHRGKEAEARWASAACKPETPSSRAW